MRYTLLKPETLQWLQDRDSVSPEDAWIRRLDGEDADEGLPPTPALDGIDEDLVWIWRCREIGLGWKEIAGMLGLKTAAGAWKRFHKMVALERKKRGLLIGEVDA